jgi:hypothetical protein
LVGKLETIVHVDKLDMMASFYGGGNFTLEPWMHKKCRINLAVWSNLTEKAQDGYFHKFIKGPPTQSAEMTSADGNYTMDYTSGTKKKPYQRRRTKAERATSAKKSGQPRGRPRKKPVTTLAPAVKRAAEPEDTNHFDSLLVFQKHAKMPEKKQKMDK